MCGIGMKLNDISTQRTHVQPFVTVIPGIKRPIFPTHTSWYFRQRSKVKGFDVFFVLTFGLTAVGMMLQCYSSFSFFSFIQLFNLLIFSIVLFIYLLTVFNNKLLSSGCYWTSKGGQWENGCFCRRDKGQCSLVCPSG